MEILSLSIDIIVILLIINTYVISIILLFGLKRIRKMMSYYYRQLDRDVDYLKTYLYEEVIKPSFSHTEISEEILEEVREISDKIEEYEENDDFVYYVDKEKSTNNCSIQESIDKNNKLQEEEEDSAYT